MSQFTSNQRIAGDELVAAFRQWEKYSRPHGQRQAIYALTAYAEAAQEQCLEGGMDGVLGKPLQVGHWCSQCDLILK
jgi:CheY-like chemotaxis protein